MDVIRDYGPLFLGSRMKRIGERLQADVARIIAQAGQPLQPSHYPLLATLDRSGPLGVAALAQAVGVSQPAATRNIAILVGLGLVRNPPDETDRRQRIVALTDAGRDAIVEAQRYIWPQVDAAMRAICAVLPGSLIRQCDALEDALNTRSLERRVASGPMAGLAIRRFTDDLAPAFHAINAQWIDAMFRLEQTDRDVLEHPRDRIVAPGGDILFVEAAGLGIVGTCALQKTGTGRFELTKMGVLPAARGRKAGEFLLHAIIRRARELGAETLYLLTNARCAAAIHLYAKIGFVHDAGIMRDFGARYARCDVAMRYCP